MDNKENEKEISKIEMLVGDIQEAIDSKDEQKLNSYVVESISNVRKLMMKVNIDKCKYLVIQYLNGIMSAFPTVRVNAYENLNVFLDKCLDEVKFEKQALLELKSYLNSCNKDKDYDNLNVFFGILVVILAMHNSRNESLKTNGDIWKCGINGINYMSVSTNDRTDEFKTAIDVGLEKLGRSRVRK